VESVPSPADLQREGSKNVAWRMLRPFCSILMSGTLCRARPFRHNGILRSKSWCWHMNNVRRLRDRSEISGTTPLRLAVAAALAYPDGSMTASGLRREAARGRLAIERTAGKDYTMLAAIEE
jgi:hypothetical protein